MTNADFAGWAAAALMVFTFVSREARVMRPLAVLTNLAFVSYSLLAWLPPVLALHLLLLPINLWRWAESCGADRKELRVRLDRMSSALVAAALIMLPLLVV
jgi:CRP/FNR family transcriptional regulator, cyclic AMP receptor protein